MQRDDDYMRAILQDALDAPEYFHDWPFGLSPDPKELFHLLLLEQAGLIARIDFHGEKYHLTDAAFTFLGGTREPEAWDRVKEIGAAAGTFGVRIMVKAAEAVAMDQLRKLGVPV